MKVWIYDENSYPSGFAGGHVPAQMPDAVRTGLRMKKVAEIPENFETAPLVILRETPSGYEDVTGRPGPVGWSRASISFLISIRRSRRPGMADSPMSISCAAM